MLRDFGVFVWAVLTNWAGFATGGILVALVWLWGTLNKVPVSRKIGLGLALIFLVMALFKAWRDQYMKNKSGLSLRIDQIRVSDPVSSVNGVPVFVVANLSNRGTPSQADGWHLEISLPNVKEKVRVAYVTIKEGSLIMEGKFRIPGSESLDRKVFGEPIPTGKKVRGILCFSALGVQKSAVISPGVLLTLSCKDIAGNTLRAKHRMKGIASNYGFGKFLGLHEEPILPEKSDPGPSQQHDPT
jgi:hypothetical protein